MTNAQLVLSISIPSVLVILSWLHNNTCLTRLEALMDSTTRRMDELQRSMSELQRGLHNDMLTFQAAILGEMANLRERVAAVEARR
jgi:hypothetical protein